MLPIMLETRDGHQVLPAAVNLPPFQLPPEVITWGARVFYLVPGQEGVATGPVRYREGMAYPLEVALVGLPQAPELEAFRPPTS